MKVLFFLVHPSKYYTFRNTINSLIKLGHEVDVAIVTKECLEQLMISEKWNVINIFPRGRKNKYIPIFLITALYFVFTIFKLFILSFKKKYDLFITDDCLTIIGKIRGIPSIFFIDNEPNTIPGINLIMEPASIILAPKMISESIKNKQLRSFNSYKELAYLHPKYFKPQPDVLRKYIKSNEPFFIIRLVSFTAIHDINKRGISNIDLKKIIKKLSAFGSVFISSERNLGSEFNHLLLNIDPLDIHQLLYFATVVISDSGTMTSEAAVLGTPTIFYSDFAGRLRAIDEKQEKYDLIKSIKPPNINSLFSSLDEMLSINNLKMIWRKKCRSMYDEKEDFNILMTNLIDEII